MSQDATSAASAPSAPSATSAPAPSSVARGGDNKSLRRPRQPKRSPTPKGDDHHVVAASPNPASVAAVAAAAAPPKPQRDRRNNSTQHRSRKPKNSNGPLADAPESAPEPPPPPVVVALSSQSSSSSSIGGVGGGAATDVNISTKSPRSGDVISPKSVTRLSRSSSEKKLDDNDCAICANIIPTRSRYVVTKCGHNEICGHCVMRLRHIVGSMECPFCKEKLDEVLFLSVTAANPRDRKLDQYKLDGLPKDDNTNIYFQSSRDSGFFRKLKSLYCPVCDFMAENSSGHKVPRFQSNAQLSAHLRSAHGKFVCDICMDHDHLFASEYRLFSSNQELQNHINFGSSIDEKSLGTEPHQTCKFCHKMFYDKDQLFTHLHREHFHCHICHRTGSQTYFASYKQLFSHFKAAHFVCHESECMDKKFVVFEDELRLRNHMLTEHANKLGSQDRKKLAQISMDFVFNDSDDRRRLYAGRRPESASSAPVVEESMIETKVQEPSEEELFPTLVGQSSNYYAVPGSLSWAARNSSHVPPTLDEFPSLPVEARPSPPPSQAPRFSSSMRNTSAPRSAAEEFPALPKPAPQPKPIIVKGAAKGKSQVSKKKGGKKESNNAWRDAISIAEPQVINPYAQEAKKNAVKKSQAPSRATVVSSGISPELSPTSEFPSLTPQPLVLNAEVQLSSGSRRGSNVVMTSTASHVGSRRSSGSRPVPASPAEDFPSLPSAPVVDDVKSSVPSISSSRRSSVGESSDDMVQSILIQCLSTPADSVHPGIINRTAKLRFKFLIELARDASQLLQARLDVNPSQLRFTERLSSTIQRYVKTQLPPDQIRDNLFIKKLGFTNGGSTTLTTLLQVAESGYSKSWAIQNLNSMDSQDLLVLCLFTVHFAS